MPNAAPTDPSRREDPAKRTVLELDLVGYSTIAQTLEQGLDVETSPKLNAQIQSFVDAGLKAAAVSRTETVMQTTGDGAILVFAQPQLAHAFVEGVNEATRAHNRRKTDPTGKRVFRIGIATGDLVMKPKPDGGYDIAGMTIARAVRLEAKADPGGVLVDVETFDGLHPEQQRRYASKEMIPGKRNEKFDAHRCLLDPDGPAIAALIAGESDEKVSPESSAGEVTGTVFDQRGQKVRGPQVNIAGDVKGPLIIGNDRKKKKRKRKP